MEGSRRPSHRETQRGQGHAPPGSPSLVNQLVRTEQRLRKEEEIQKLCSHTKPRSLTTGLDLVVDASKHLHLGRGAHPGST